MNGRSRRHRIRALILVLGAFTALAGCTGAGSPTVGDEAPGFVLPEAGGTTVSLDDYSGEPVLLYFHMADG